MPVPLQKKKDPTKISLSVINCRSVRNKTAYLNDFILDNKFDCVALTETWLSSEDSSNNITLSALIPSTYKIFHVPRLDAKGGGVAFIYRDHYKVKMDSSFSAASFESMTVLMDAGSHTFRFIVLYRVPPSAQNKIQKSLFLSELADLLELTVTQSGRLVLAGDFNVHWDCQHDAERNHLVSLLNSHDLVQHVLTPTHEDGHTLDLVITRTGDNLVASCMVGEFISDHNALHITLNCCKQHPLKKSITYRNWKSLDIAAVAHHILSSPLFKQPPTCLDDAIQVYNIVLEHLIDQQAPIKTRMVVDRPSQRWITEDILSVKRERRHAEAKWRKSRLEVHKLAYKYLCVKVKDLVSKAKAEFYVQKIQNCEGDQKKLFQIVNGLMGCENPNILPVASSDLTLTELLNSFFICKIATFRDELANLETTVSEFSSEMMFYSPGTTLMESFRQIDVDEVIKFIKKLSTATCQLDPIPTVLVIKLLPQLAPYICKIVNMSLISGSFPSKLKTAIVHPLIKKPGLDSEILNNYRPVSQLAYISKIIEKVVASQIQEHMKKNGLLETMQSAYKEAHSTETALLRVQNDILTALDQRKGVYLILLDLSAAFDTVDHELLLSFLHNHVGLRGSVLDFFRSYLSDRTQCVSIHGVLSELSHLAFGIPQGSVLGPMLFCMYTLPLGAILRHHGLSYHLYADDTQIGCVTDLKNPQEDLNRASMCINDIRTWMIRNKLKINDSKTKFLFIKSPHVTLDSNSGLQLSIGHTIIEPSTSCRNLGVMFDDEMNFECQIRSICRAANLHLRNISAVRPFLTESAAEQLVHAFITSRLDYCNSLLYGLPDYKIQRLQRLQNTAARIIVRCPKISHITPVLFKLHWLPVQMRIRFKVLLLVYRCVNDLAPAYLCNLVTPLQHDRITRSSSQHLLNIPSSRLKKYGDRSFSVCGPKEWNLLPLYIKLSSSVESFKSNLKPHLFAEHYQHLIELLD